MHLVPPLGKGLCPKVKEQQCVSLRADSPGVPWRRPWPFAAGPCVSRSPPGLGSVALQSPTGSTAAACGLASAAPTPAQPDDTHG